MNAARRLGSVKVINSSSAEVRNSAVELTGTVFMRGPLDEFEAAVELDFASDCAAEEEVVLVPALT